MAEDEERAEHEPDVAHHVDHERLDPGAGRGRAPVPERDQHVGGRADERPADDQQHEVARQHQQQHREDEEVQVCEVARVAAVLQMYATEYRWISVETPETTRIMKTDSGSTRICQLRVDAGAEVVVPQRSRSARGAPGRGPAARSARPTANTNESEDRGGPIQPAAPAAAATDSRARSRRPDSGQQQRSASRKRRHQPVQLRSVRRRRPGAARR